MLLLAGFFLPTDWSVEESVTVEASPEEVHTYVSDLRTWKDWVMWSQTDPSLEIDYGKVTQGKGAAFSWRSERSGSGHLTITESDPQQGIEFQMSLQGNDSGHGAIRYEPRNGETVVRWTDEGEVGMRPVGGYFVLLVEPTLSEHFQRSLSQLERLIESNATQ